jgi:hypothetical protein
MNTYEVMQSTTHRNDAAIYPASILYFSWSEPGVQLAAVFAIVCSNMHACVCVCMYVCICMYIYIYIYRHDRIHICFTYTCIYIHILAL